MVASEARIDNVVLPVTYKVPVLVEAEEMMLTWTVDTQSEVTYNIFDNIDIQIFSTKSSKIYELSFKHLLLPCTNSRTCAATTSAS